MTSLYKEFRDCSLKDGILYKSSAICFPQGEHRLQWLHMSHHSNISKHFGVEKMDTNFAKVFILVKSGEVEVKPTRSCPLHNISKATNWKLGKYITFLVSSIPYESILIDFLGVYPWQVGAMTIWLRFGMLQQDGRDDTLQEDGFNTIGHMISFWMNMGQLWFTIIDELCLW